MNCFPEPGIRHLAVVSRQSGVVATLGLLALCAGFASDAAAATEARPDRVYGMHYRVTPAPGAHGAHVVLTLTQRDDLLREMDMPLRDGQISDLSGDGRISLTDGRAVWEPPADGGELRWFATLAERRGSETYDAWIEEDWALFRAEDIIPSAATRTLRGAASDTTLSFELPAKWSSVTPWFGRDDSYRIDNPERRFDTPTGWIVLGRLGVRNETIGHVRTRVAGPVGQSVRRMDILALMRWTLPELLRILPDFPQRLTFVSAGEPMWRGALAGPQSVYVHADRPLISENGTSTMLHETMHIGLGLTGAAGADWIVEGLAEYYSLELLVRSGTISRTRYRRAHSGLASWGRETRDLCTRHSTGSSTARAVALFAELDAEIRDVSDGNADLDDLLRELAGYDRKISVRALRDIAERIAGGSLDTLESRNIPGCGGSQDQESAQ